MVNSLATLASVMRRLLLLIISITVFNLSGYAQGLRIKEVNFNGNEILEKDELLGQMNTQPKKGLEKLFFWKKHPDFIEVTLTEDINRLLTFYNRNGFLNPEISFNLDTLSGKLVEINIDISENDFVKTRGIEIALTGDGTTSILLDSLRTGLPLKEGSRFRDDDVFNTETVLKRSFSDHGYPFTTVNRDIRIVDDTSTANLVFDLDAGKRSYFGEVTVSGDSLIPEKFIRKYLLFDEGELYMQRKIDSTQQDIFGTDLFQYVVIASKKDSVTDDRIPVEVIVKELPRWKLEAGAGYGTEDRLRLAAELTRLSFLGGARRLIINAKTSYFLPFSLDTRFVQPDFIFPRLDLVLNPFYLREREISYTIDRMGGAIRFIYAFRNNLNAHFSYSFENDRLLELTDLQLDPEQLKHNKSVFSLGGEINTSNDMFYPTRGHRIEGNVSLAGLGHGAKVNYYKLQASYIRYVSLSKDLTLATKIKGGVIQTLEGGRDTPIEERFYLGGVSSLRGWGRNRISALNPLNLALGGNSMAELSAELRFPVYELLYGAIFADAGNVWYESWSVEPPDLHYNVGIGLHVRTPIGPVRLDFATPIINDSFRLQFSLSVGHAF